MSGNVPSAEGLLVEFKGSAGGSGRVTQSVQSPGDAFGSAAENPDSLTETHTYETCGETAGSNNGVVLHHWTLNSLLVALPDLL